MKKFIIRHWLLLLSFVYIIWPMDIVSDLFGPIGLIDDAGILFTAVIHELIIYFDKENKKREKK